MKYASLCFLATLSAVTMAGAVRAETEAEYLNPGPGSRSTPWTSGERGSQRAPAPARRLLLPTGPGATEPVKPKPRHASAAPSTMFAPAAAAHARRLSPQQREERQFLRNAAAGSRFEAEAARMALGKSSNPGVRSFAATLINHHASAGNELLHMLHARGMAAPMLANEQRSVLNRLAKLQGTRFDREFLQEVALKRQQEDVDEYEKASLLAGEPRLKAWIDRTLPTLRYHASTAERLAPADVKLARGAAPLPRGSINRAVARTNLSAPPARAGDPSAPTMQFGGMPLGGQQFGGAEQLGVARPFAGRPSELNTR